MTFGQFSNSKHVVLWKRVSTTPLFYKTSLIEAKKKGKRKGKEVGITSIEKWNFRAKKLCNLYALHICSYLILSCSHKNLHQKYTLNITQLTKLKNQETSSKLLLSMVPFHVDLCRTLLKERVTQRPSKDQTKNHLDREKK